MNVEKTNKFLSYINNPLSRSSIDVIYGGNNIVFERCDLYKDFVLSVSTLIFDTYMGDDITTNAQRLKHFNWCWQKTIENFEKEGIVFEIVDELYDYFLNFMVEVYYSVEDKELDNIPFNVIKLWKYIFNYNIVKTRSDIDTFLEVYELFEKSLKKRQNP